MVIAPENFSALSGKLLVANFGDGTIAAFDPTTREFAGFMHNAKGKPVVIDKIWGMLGIATPTTSPPALKMKPRGCLEA